MIISHCLFIFYYWFTHVAFKNYFSSTKISRTTWFLNIKHFPQSREWLFPFLWCWGCICLNCYKQCWIWMLLTCFAIYKMKKVLWWLKILSSFANFSNPGYFFSNYKQFMHFNMTLNIAVFDHFIWYRLSLSQTSTTRHLLWSGIFTLRFS